MNHRKCPTCSEVDKFNLIGTMLNCTKCGCEIALEDYEISTKWVPTEEELDELGFTYYDSVYSTDVADEDARVIYYPFPGMDYNFLAIESGFNGKSIKVYPKSLSELKTLISMMKP